MTGYHIGIGYNGATRVDHEEMWQELKEAARKVADNPNAIIAEARRLNAPESCNDGCELDGYADNYTDPFGSSGHPITIIEDGDNRQVMQLAAAGCGVKYAVRRAYIRLLIEEMHRRDIEVNITVA